MDSDIKVVVRSILDIISSLKDIENIDGNELSEKALTLSVNKVYLGQNLARLEHELSTIESVRKKSWNQAYFDQRVMKRTVGDSEIFADNAISDIVKEKLELKRKVDIIKNLRQDCSDVVTTIQTRISQLRSEMIESKS